MNSSIFLWISETKEAVFSLVEYPSNSQPWNTTPSVFEGGNQRIMWEVYEVDTQTLEELDRFEQVGKFYKRILIELLDGEQAYMYISLPREISKNPEEKFTYKKWNSIWWKQNPPPNL